MRAAVFEERSAAGVAHVSGQVFPLPWMQQWTRVRTPLAYGAYPPPRLWRGGGANSIRNIRAVCVACHELKDSLDGSRRLDEVEPLALCARM